MKRSCAAARPRGSRERWRCRDGPSLETIAEHDESDTALHADRAIVEVSIKISETVLTQPHLSVMRSRRAPVKIPDARLLDDVVNPLVLEAMRRASDAMKSIGVRHIVVGGLAVGASGYPRATAGVDFLIGDEAFEHHAGGVVTLRVPIQVNGIAIDYLSVGTDEKHLGDAISAEPGSFASVPVLVYLKLKSPRSKDRTDVIELIKAGMDVNVCRAYLANNAPHFVAAFDDAVRAARAEE